MQKQFFLGVTYRDHSESAWNIHRETFSINYYFLLLFLRSVSLGTNPPTKLQP